MIDVRIESLTKTYLATNGRPVPVLRQFELDVPGGMFTTVLGPNGCGKSTLLRILDGLDAKYDGEVRLGDSWPGEVPTAYIFQNYAESLYPWKNVLDNIAFPLEIGRVSRRKRRERAANLLDELELDLPKDAYPYQLSGGQQQMVAIARGLITNPRLLLMDEPFGSLDCEIRFHLQERLLSIWRNRCPSVVFVSHEVDEAVYLADRVVVLSRRPSRVADVIDVDLPRPRARELLEQDRFLRLKARVERAFRRAVLGMETSSEVCEVAPGGPGL